MTKPRAIDLFAGLGGWTDGLLAEGYDVTGYDIEAHVYGEHRYPAELVLQDVCTLHGAQFKDVALIVASPPCLEYSYMAMPWSLAKAKAAAIRADTSGEKLAALNRLFNECFRIQKEASFAAGHLIPLVVENVRGAQPWVGRARWNHGSFFLWGDVPALMPTTMRRSGVKAPGMNWSDPSKRGQDFTRLAGKEAIKNNGGSWFAVAHNTTSGKGQNPDGRKQPGIAGPRANGKGDAWFQDGAAQHGSKSPQRKMASAMIAKIPLSLSRHIAATYRS